MSKLDINEIRKITKEQQDEDLQALIRYTENEIEERAELGLWYITVTPKRECIREIRNHFEKLGFEVSNNIQCGVVESLIIIW